jgi:hypothetical protein
MTLWLPAYAFYDSATMSGAFAMLLQEPEMRLKKKETYRLLLRFEANDTIFLNVCG